MHTLITVNGKGLCAISRTCAYNDMCTLHMSEISIGWGQLCVSALWRVKVKQLEKCKTASGWRLVRICTFRPFFQSSLYFPYSCSPCVCAVPASHLLHFLLSVILLSSPSASGNSFSCLARTSSILGNSEINNHVPYRRMCKYNVHNSLYVANALIQ